MNVAIGSRRKSSCRLAIALLAAVGALTPAIAETTIHKWVDEKGVTHYSQDPPLRRKSETITIQTAPGSPGAKAAPRAAPQAGKTVQQEEIEFQRRQRAREAAELRERAKARAAARKQAQCASARAQGQRVDANCPPE
jgi:hypothetical protein